MKRALTHGSIALGWCGLTALVAVPACGPAGSPTPPIAESSRGLVRAEGEVLVVDGDLDFNVGSIGGVLGTGVGERQALLSQVANELTNNPNLVDSFDAVVVFTTFDDAANSADSVSELLFNEVAGIGLLTPQSETPIPDDREAYGLRPGTALHRRLRNLVYFNRPSVFLPPGGDLPGLNQVEGDFHALVARRLASRWLFNPLYSVGEGEDREVREDLRGPREAGDIAFNWSNLADAEGSIMGGYDFRDEGEGMFTNLGTNLGFAPLDLYFMGFVGPENVSDFFIIRSPRLGGSPLDPASDIPDGATVSGEAEFVSLDQIVDVLGPRVPAAFDVVPYQRIAFVLLTVPGQAAEDYAEQLAFVQGLQQSFPESWKAWTGVSLCTRVTGTCPEPALVVDDFTISDDNDNLIAPGETVQLDLEIRNVGLGVASGARIRFAVEQSVGLQVSPGSLDLPDVPQDEEINLPQPVSLTVTSTNCGEPVTLRTIIELAEGPQTGQALSIPIGTEGVRFDPLNEAPDWTVNPDGTDTAGDGVWSLGVPEAIQGPAGVLTQPPRDHSIGDAELAFMTQPRSDGLFARSDVDGGRTTLESPIFALGETRDPTVRVWVWRTAYDFTEREPVPLENPLTIEVSNDGGATWSVVREFREQTTEWTPVDIRLRTPVLDIRPTNRMQFRFWIEDDTRNGVGNIEAGIDDLEIFDFLPGCPGLIPPEEPVDPGPVTGGDDEDESGGCRAVGADAPVVLAVLLGGLALMRRRRRV